MRVKVIMNRDVDPFTGTLSVMDALNFLLLLSRELMSVLAASKNNLGGSPEPLGSIQVRLKTSSEIRHW